MLQDACAGDPMTGLKWTRKTLRALQRELKRKGFKVAIATIRRLLRKLRYAIRVNRKRLTREQNPDRDHQMRYQIRVRRRFLKDGKPVISADTKKRELVGNFKNAGGMWRREPIPVLEYDYRSQADGVAIPYGIYDVAANDGFVVIGISHQTPAFAIAAIRRWWIKVGRIRYAGQQELLIQVDSGNPNSSRSWLWKFGLQQMSDELGLQITVTHFPPGASKWNPVEHRLFSQITQNWAGQPLISYETVLKFIRTTKTDAGLRVRAYLDKIHYQTGVKLTAAQKAQINLSPLRVFPKLNYTIKPR